VLIQVELPLPQGTPSERSQSEEAAKDTGPPTILGRKRGRSDLPQLLATTSITPPSPQQVQIGGTVVKHKLLKEPLQPATPECNSDGNASRSNPVELAEMVYKINKAVEKYTEELQDSSGMDVPTELSLFMQVSPPPVPTPGHAHIVQCR
jgi:hypothetical protein